MNRSNQSNTVNRRHFIGGLSAMAAGISTRSIHAANDTIGVGIIGCGGRSNAHIKTLQQLKESGNTVEITAVCDVYKPRLDQAVERTNAKPYMHHEELLKDPNVDIVVITSPDHWHGYQLLDAIRAGKDVYCEKPITHWSQLALTRQLDREVKRTERIVQVGTQGMSNSTWTQVAQLIQSGAIGEPIHAQAGYFRIGDWGERMPIPDPEAKPGDELLWEKFLGDAPERPFSVSRFFQWRLYWDYAGGPSTDLFNHTLTPVVKMLGVTFPDYVSASGGKFRYNHDREVPDTFNMTIDYPEGISVVLSCTLGNDTGIPTVIRGFEGTITFENNNIVVTPQPGVDRPKKVDPIQRKESMVGFWRNFLSCCQSREKPWSDMELAYHVQVPLQMGVYALRERDVIKFDHVREEIQLNKAEGSARTT